MTLTVYQVGSSYSLRDSYEATAITLEVPPGTEIKPFARLGLCAFVPSGPMIRTLHEARDLMTRAHDRHRCFRVLSVIDARDRQFEARAAAIREEQRRRKGA